jgi:hypothetical protein
MKVWQVTWLHTNAVIQQKDVKGGSCEPLFFYIRSMKGWKTVFLVLGLLGWAMSGFSQTASSINKFGDGKGDRCAVRPAVSSGTTSLKKKDYHVMSRVLRRRNKYRVTICPSF